MPTRDTTIQFELFNLDDDFDGLGDDGMDVKGLSKRDMHTLNEQRRRDSIKVHSSSCLDLCIEFGCLVVCMYMYMC